MQGLTDCLGVVPIVCGAKQFSSVVHNEEAGQAGTVPVIEVTDWWFRI